MSLSSEQSVGSRMTSAEVRRAFIEFFQGKGHEFVASSPQRLFGPNFSVDKFDVSADGQRLLIALMGDADQATAVAPAQRMPHRDDASRSWSGVGLRRARRVIRLVQMPGDEHLDERLARHADTGGFPVERLDHPHGEIDVDALLFETGTTALRPVNELADVLARVEQLIELFSRNSFQSRSSAIDAPR